MASDRFRLHPCDPVRRPPFFSRVNRKRNREPGRRSVPTFNSVARREAKVLDATYRIAPPAKPTQPAPSKYGVTVFSTGRGSRAQVRPVSQLNTVLREA